MSKQIQKTVLAVAAIAAIGVGASAIADAASSKSGTTTTPAAQQAAPVGAPKGAPSDAPRQHPGEKLLTGDTKTKVTAAAEAKVPGAKVIRVETDAEGSPYEAHMQKSDGSMVTVKVDKAFKATKVEQGMGPGPGGRHGAGPPPPTRSY